MIKNQWILLENIVSFVDIYIWLIELIASCWLAIGFMKFLLCRVEIYEDNNSQVLESQGSRAFFRSHQVCTSTSFQFEFRTTSYKSVFTDINSRTVYLVHVMQKKNTIAGTVLLQICAILLLLLILLNGIPANSIISKINIGNQDITCIVGERANISPQVMTYSIEKGLEFLNNTPLDNGGWLEGNNGASCHVTGICLRALMNYKGIREPYKNTIRNGIEFLKDSWHDPSDYPAGQQRDKYGGLIFNDKQLPEENNSNILRSHGAATGALLNYYLHAQDISIMPYINASVEMVVRAQNTPRKPNTMGGPRAQGGWGPCPNATNSVTSLSGWNLFPLRLAESTGIYDVPDDAFEYVKKWLLSCYDGLFGENSSAAVGSDITAIATYCLYTLGTGNTIEAQNGIDHINNQILQWNTESDPIGSNGNCPYLWYYYSTYSMYLAGGNEWSAWKSQMSSLLLDNQNENGSWSPLQNEIDLGFNYATAMALMCLELIYEPVELSLVPKGDPGCDCSPNVKMVEPEEIITYDFEVRAHPISVEGSVGAIRVNLTISEPLEGWSAELYTPTTSDDGIVLPNGSRMWWVTVSHHDGPPIIHLNVTAPEIGIMSEPCVIDITATIEDDYRYIQVKINAISMLNIDGDFKLDFIADTDNLGNKVGTVEAGSIKTFRLSIQNLGNFNDSYELSLFSDTPYPVSFLNGGPTFDLNLSKEGMVSYDFKFLDIFIETPLEAKKNETINLTVIGTSKMYALMGLRTLSRSDKITLTVTDSPILLNCHDTIKYIDPAEKKEYEISITNYFESTLDFNFSFYSNRTQIESSSVFALDWTARFPVNNFTVNSGESIDVIFEVGAPKYAIYGDRIDVIIVVVGYDESGMEYEPSPLQVSAIVNRIVDITAKIEPLNQSCYPGNTVNFTLNITNEGNVEDVANIDEYELPEDWELNFSKPSILLDPFQSVFVDMMLIVPENALENPDINLTEGIRFMIGLVVTNKEDMQGVRTILFVNVTVFPPAPIKDVTPPRIENVSHNIIQMSDEIIVNIKVKVIDELEVDEVWVSIINPDGNITNISLTGSQMGEIYSYEGILSIFGDYEYYFWVKGKENNQNISNIYTFNLEELEDNDNNDNSSKNEEEPFMSKFKIRWLIIGLFIFIVLCSVILFMYKRNLIFSSIEKERERMDEEQTVDNGEDEFGRVRGEMNKSQE